MCSSSSFFAMKESKIEATFALDLSLTDLAQQYLQNNLSADIFWRRLNMLSATEDATFMGWIKEQYIVREEFIPGLVTESPKRDNYSRREWLLLAKVFQEGLGVKENRETARTCVEKAKLLLKPFEIFSIKEKQLMGEIEANPEDYVLAAFEESHRKSFMETVTDYLEGQIEPELFWKRYLRASAKDLKTLDEWLMQNYVLKDEIVSLPYLHRFNLLIINSNDFHNYYSGFFNQTKSFFELAKANNFPNFSPIEIIFYYYSQEENIYLEYLSTKKADKDPFILALLAKHSKDAELTKACMLASYNLGGTLFLVELANVYKDMEVPNHKKMLEVLEEAIIDGDTTALAVLAFLHKEGMGVEKDLTKASLYYEAALKQSRDPKMSAQLALTYFERNTNLDYAYSCMRFAAQAGNEGAIAYFLNRAFPPKPKKLLRVIPIEAVKYDVSCIYHGVMSIPLHRHFMHEGPFVGIELAQDEYASATISLRELFQKQIKNKKFLADIDLVSDSDPIDAIDTKLKYNNLSDLQLLNGGFYRQIQSLLPQYKNVSPADIVMSYFIETAETHFPTVLRLAKEAAKELTAKEEKLHPVAVDLQKRKENRVKETYDNLCVKAALPPVCSFLITEYAFNMHSMYFKKLHKTVFPTTPVERVPVKKSGLR